MKTTKASPTPEKSLDDIARENGWTFEMSGIEGTPHTDYKFEKDNVILKFNRRGNNGGASARLADCKPVNIYHDDILGVKADGDSEANGCLVVGLHDIAMLCGSEDGYTFNPRSVNREAYAKKVLSVLTRDIVIERIKTHFAALVEERRKVLERAEGVRKAFEKWVATGKKP